MLERKEIIEGQPGFFPKNFQRYRYCGDYHDEGLRCTRVAGHKGRHAAHVEKGVEGTTETVRNAEGEVIDVRVIPGMKNTQVVQIATWDNQPRYRGPFEDVNK